MFSNPMSIERAYACRLHIIFATFVARKTDFVAHYTSDL